MNILQSSLYAAALVSCLLLIFAIGGAVGERRRRGKYLFALLSLLALNFGFEWLMSNPATPLKSLWLASVMGLALFLGPCLWLHARSIDAGAGAPVPRLRDLPRWHFLVAMLGLLLLLPLAGKIHFGSEFQHPDSVLPVSQPSLVHSTMLACILVFALQAGWYLRGSRRILVRHANAAKALLSDLQDRELNTLRVLILVVGVHWVFGMARAAHCLLLGKDAGYVGLFAVCEVMFTVWAAISLMRGGLPVVAADRQLANDLDKDLADDRGEAKYARSALDGPARERIRRKLGEAWSQHHLHLDSQLTLRSLCAHLRENPHYVSQVINQDLQTSFYDLVNRQRIDAARDILVRSPDRAVLEIALAVGFNSKSTFNAAFRQHVGDTPSGFRRANRARGCPVTSP